METSFARLPRYVRLGLAAALVAALPLVVRLSWLGPRMQELDAKRAALAGREAALAEAHRERAGLAQARGRVDELGLRLDRLVAARSRPEEISALLRRLQIFAVQSELTIRAFRPRQAPQEGLPAAWSYRLHVEGTYQGLTGFFRRVGGLSRIVTIDDVVIRAFDPPEPGRTVAAECTATAFVLPDPSRPGRPAPEEAHQASAPENGADARQGWLGGGRSRRRRPPGWMVVARANRKPGAGAQARPAPEEAR